MPKWATMAALVLIALALVPLACIARARAVKTPNPQWHVFPDMDNQLRFANQQPNPLFADGRSMRPPVPGTVPRGGLTDDGWLHRGVVGDDWATGFPIEITATTLSRGRERYDVFCAPCHGLSGYGDGPVAKRAENLQEGTWVQPSSFHTELVRGRPLGHLFNSITNGIRNMPAYGPQISPEDRWAIVAYARALQRSQYARVEDVPAELRPNLR
jgi:mono/diheme cytochrome c family protein